TDRPIFLNDNEDHPVQNRESLENYSKENVVSKTNQEPPQDSDIHQLIKECSIKVPEEQKQKMENTIALNSKLLSINSINSQRLDKKEQEVKNVIEQPAGRKNHAEKSIQNFRVIHKSSISFKNTSQISSIHAVAPIQSTEEPEHLLSMGYEHFSITPKMESNEVTESNAENLLPIPIKCEVTLEDKIEYDMPAKDDYPHCFNVESDFVESLLNRDTFIDFPSKFDFSGELAHIIIKIPKSDFHFEEEIRLIENLLYDNSFPRPPEELNAEIADTIIESIPLLPIPVQDGNSQQEDIDIVTETNDVLPPSVENDDDDYDLLLGEADFVSLEKSNKNVNGLHPTSQSGSKDRPPIAPGNYIQWKSRIKRYIDTKPNRELIHYCFVNPPYELGWKEKPILDAEGNPTNSTDRVFETYQNVKQEIRDQLNAEVEAVQIILTGIDNDIYSTVDACPNACEMWKAIERLKQGESINVQDLETNLFWEFGKFTSLDGETLESYYSRFYKMMNELTRNH
nr:hypothetical protein [Tanacetum cinerariifolium]